MKCRTVRDIRADVNCYPAYVTINEMGRDIIAAGVVICRDEFPLADCVTLVRNGLAIPEDEECRVACDRTEEQLTEAREAMDKMLNPPDETEEEDDDEDDD